MKYMIGIVAMIWCSVLYSQRSADLRIVEQSAEEAADCYDVQLSFTGDEAVLGSQNYRIYYNAAALKFISPKSKMYLPDEFYSFRIVQHNEGIDATGVGKLSFEGNLGFINATVILNDARAKAFRLSESEEWSSILTLCFDRSSEMDQSQVILARKNLTGDYGRAFIELSYIDETGAIATLPINNYQDIGK